MQVSDVMTRCVECVGPEDTIQAAADRMRELDVGAMPVCENDHLAGMITDRDITVRAVAEGWDPGATTVRDVMTPEVICCFDDQDVADAARLMRDKQVRRLPVLNRNKRLVGIVVLGDLAADTGDEQLAGHALEGISQPALPMR